ncbi:cytochrome c-type biogenesis protein CcmH [Reinekea sp.]|jgi:cytochrome c-type biogenesis protein CcmH|uniref:cytochrome c-type biogenesis protein n=1 Tax=Reinekea sp. TaxID=1970455 RepID=UPI00398A0D70
MKWFSFKLSTFAFLFMLAASSVYAANELLTFDNEELRERYLQLSFEFRCPKCLNQNVADSNAPISEDIRQKTYEMLHQGFSDQEIVDYMVDRYTEFVIYKPQMSFLTIWLWILPFGLLFAGLLVVWQIVSKPNSEATETISAEDSERLKKLLEDQ